MKMPFFVSLFVAIMILAGCSATSQTTTGSPLPTPTNQTDSNGNRLQLSKIQVRPSTAGSFVPTPTPTSTAASTNTPTNTPAPTPTPTPLPEPSSTVCPRYQAIPGNPPGCRCPEIAECEYPDGRKCRLGRQLCLLYSAENINMDLYCGYELVPPQVLQQTLQERQQCDNDFQANRCFLWCAAKPVIYLYPEVPTLIDVALDIPGVVTVSNPLYPAGGWKNVLAMPNGQLFYETKGYPYLFYETEVDKPKLPDEGIVATKQHLTSVLYLVTHQLGLNAQEQHDFLEYWGPRLAEIDTPYVLIQLLTKAEKDRVDHVIISPKPDVMIELLFSFTPLEQPIEIKPMQLPATPPGRHGFTAVEWGGGITEPDDITIER